VVEGVPQGLDVLGSLERQVVVMETGLVFFEQNFNQFA
jgi:hypothetical protein